MFESHPPCLALPPHSLHPKISSLTPPGPFLIEKCSMACRESRRASPEWPTDCHLRYLAFLQSCGMDSEQLRGRAAWTPFARMAKFIPSRNINQCRMHHKRMLREHLTPQGILTAHAPLIRQLAPSFRRYTQEATTLTQGRIAETNKRSKLLKSVIIGQRKVLPSVSESPPQAVEAGKKGEDLIPTDVAYPEETGNIAVNNRRNATPYYPFFQPNIPLMGESFFSSGRPIEGVVSGQKRRQWQQCHQLFMAWTTKLHSLLS